jgi:hypothetical protein
MAENKILGLSPNPEASSSIGVSQEFSKKEKIYINLEKNQITIITIEKQPIFNDKGIYFIECDSGGSSFIKKEKNGYHLINVLRNGYERKEIENKLLTNEEVKDIIRDTIYFRGKEK